MKMYISHLEVGVCLKYYVYNMFVFNVDRVAVLFDVKKGSQSPISIRQTPRLYIS